MATLGCYNYKRDNDMAIKLKLKSRIRYYEPMNRVYNPSIRYESSIRYETSIRCEPSIRHKNSISNL